MKVRTGFVSNSSSSSFLIYGIAVEDIDTLKKSLSKTTPKADEEVEEGDEDNYEFLETLLDKPEAEGLEYHVSDYCNWIGASWDTVGDDETGAQFKKRVELSIKQLLGKKMKCETIGEVIYN